MFNQCKIAVRCGAFIGMVLALFSSLYFLTCSSPPEQKVFIWMCTMGSSVDLQNMDDKEEVIASGLDRFDYVRQRIYSHRQPIELILK